MRARSKGLTVGPLAGGAGGVSKTGANLAEEGFPYLTGGEGGPLGLFEAEAGMLRLTEGNLDGSRDGRRDAPAAFCLYSDLLTMVLVLRR